MHQKLYLDILGVFHEDLQDLQQHKFDEVLSFLLIELSFLYLFLKEDSFEFDQFHKKVNS